MRIDRELLLRKLETVRAGLAIKEAVEQSSCFVFRGGRVYTFNDEVFCSNEIEVGFEGAVAAKQLLDLLGKLTEEEITIEVDGGEMLVKGKRRRAGITLENEIRLPIDAVEEPETWHDLDPTFGDAVQVVGACASTDANTFALTCIHITPEYVEACDNMQLARYPVETGLEEECLVKRSSLKNIVGLGMTEVGPTEGWVHYRNTTGLVISMRKEVADYVELDGMLEVSGVRTTLPNSLVDAIDKATVFSEGDNAVVTVSLRQGKLRLKGFGAAGWYEELRELPWDGEDIAFNIEPKLLSDIVGKANDCYIAEERLKIDGGKFIYVTCLEKT